MSDAPRGEVAIVGMACIYPGAGNVQQFWENILQKKDAISDPPADWEADFYYDPESQADDRTYCKRGGYLGKLAQFNPLEFGVMPNAIDGCVPDHFLALRVAQEALEDAGYADPLRLGPLKERTGVILGHGAYINRGHSALIQHLMVVDSILRILKQLYPEYTEEQLAALKKELKASAPPLQPQNAPGLVPNMISGRIANRLDLMGPSYIVDGACASSLLAVDMAMRELLTGKCDMVVAGGVHCGSTPPIVIAFSQLQALSRKGEIRSFDSAADGTLLSEGLGMLILRRLADAERDGNKIYAVLKGVGVASDGRAMGLLAPRLEGEELALRRAYEAAAVEPASVGLIEGHGTATLVGDATELEALNRVFGARSGDVPRCALGSVKSMIGHCIPASGLAGIIKVALALHQKVLPPTINCTEPNAKLSSETSNLYINTETRPWIHGSQRSPRRGGVSAFGFGGINAHAVLEEYTGSKVPANLQHQWDSELFVISGDTRHAMLAEAERVHAFAVDTTQSFTLKDLAWSLNCDRQRERCRLAIVATSREDLCAKLERSIARLADAGTSRIRDLEGIYYFQKPLAGDGGKLAFVFPGEGSQYLNMLADLSVHFPEVRRAFDLMDRAFQDHPRGYLPSEVIVPPPLHPATQRLWSMDVGTEAVFCANLALFELLDHLGVRPDAMVGHSTGENSALPCSGMVQLADDAELVERVQVLNRVFEELRNNNQIAECSLLAVGGVPPERLWQMAKESNGQLYVAMDNCPNQVVLCGTEEAIVRTLDALAGGAAVCQRLPFSRAYHTPWFKNFSDMLRQYLGGLRVARPLVPLYTCVNADLFPDDLEQIREIASSGWSRTVRFRETIEKMYSDGIRMFVEVGPRANLTSFIDDTLRGKSHLAVASNVPYRSGILQMHHLLGQLAAHGLPLQLEHLYERRAPRPVDRPVRTKPAVQLLLGMQPVRLRDGFQLPGSPREARRMEAAPEPVPHAPSRAIARAVSDPGVFAHAALATGADASHASPPADIRSALSPRAAVVQQHFNTMEQFLAVQQQVFGAFFTNRSETPPPVPARPASDSTPLPYASEILEIVPGVRARMRHRFSLEPLYQHHALGFDVSAEDPSLVGLCVVPLTVSVEMLAEAASVLEPGRVVVGVREMRSQRWIMLDEPGPTIELTAERKAPGVVEVKIREGDADRAIRPVWIEGTVLFADDYPGAGLPMPFHLTDSKPSRWTPGTLYPQGMFHGPLMRGVISVDRTGKNGASATLEILTSNGLLRAFPIANFLLDPLCIDAVGQLTAFWSQEHVDPFCDLFPYHFGSLECFSPMPPAGTRVEGRILITHVGEREIRCDLEVLDWSGVLLYRIRGWEVRRFLQSGDLWNYRICPRDAMLSKPSDEWMGNFGASSSLACCRLDRFPPGFLETSFGVWLKMLALLSLGPRERESWGSMKAVDKRRIDWLLGRCAAKDAVRTLVRRKFGLALYPADIEILPDAQGAPRVYGAWTKQLGVQPVVSISHSGGSAVALAALDADHLVGIDIESVSPVREGFEAVAFTPQEREIVAAMPDQQRREWFLRLWCAKEALGKALGRGLSQGLKSLEVMQIQPESGRVQLSIRNGLSEAFPHLRDKSLSVYTNRNEQYVFSTFIHSPGSVE
jgi:phosphopantetheine--protein transferase-like protein